MQEFKTIEDAQRRIEALEQELKETELRLCEFDIEKNSYIKKYAAADRERIQYLNETVQLKMDLTEAVNTLELIKNSTIWRKTEGLRKVITKIRGGEIPQPVVEKVQVEETEKSPKHISKYEENIDFSSLSTDIKPIALYLPQYHSIPENDQWWGEGFTEWTNVKKATSRYVEHNQPRIPEDDFGYYNLTDVEVIKKQVELAKQHSIYGFAFYYYWFSGKRLLEKPMDIFLEHKEIDFPFMAVWANENWTRTWDGMENNVLIAQEYSEDDPVNFILDLKKYIDDERYIRVDGKPVIGLYAPAAIPNLKDVLKKWRKTAQKCGIGDILIWICMSNSTAEQLEIEKYVDGQYEFPPRMKGDVTQIARPDDGISFNYKELMENERHILPQDYSVPTYRGSMLEWDNSARKKTNYHCWYDYTVEDFYTWNCINTAYTRHYFDEDHRFIFINAWNEWGEGTYLEPDAKYGYAAINALSRAIHNLPFDGQPTKKFDKVGFWKNPLADDIILTGCDLPKSVLPGWDTHLLKVPRIAVQAHVFYPELIGEICNYLDNIPYAYDLYISTNEKYKASYIERYLKDNCSAQRYYIEVTANKGRDVVPFIMQMKDHIRRYEYICHIHTKKSMHNDIGDVWRKYLYDNLLGSKEVLRQIFYMFESQQNIGVIFPENMANLKKFIEWGSNKELAQWLFRKMNMEESKLVEDIIFPAGNMFWARTSAVKDVFEIKYKDSDFPEERGQVDGTIMHAIERIWLFVAEENGYKYQIVRNVLDDVALFE
ncbi:MAG: glycoside hydrolase family 99-like domain-containing protein [Oscillospiraceae bacterium]|nr:glycoside hydrolase family 99-like domain-containing protein [Oscillospiraceae bacterium]